MTKLAPAPIRRGGRPTRAAAAERDERLLEIATAMFMEQGFEATSMDGLAEAAAVGKATLYARWADKTALFADVLRRRILQVYGPLEDEFRHGLDGVELELTLMRVATGLLDSIMTPSAVALGRILSSQGSRFPDLVELAMREGHGRQVRLVETILARHADEPMYRIDDPTQLADLFLSLVLGRSSRLAIYGVFLDRQALIKRTEAAIELFMRGIRRKGETRQTV